MTLRATVAKIPPTQRAALAAKRLAVLPNVQEVTIRPAGKGFVLLANGKVILQVDPADAITYRTSPSDLAGTWKQAINEALLLPPIAFGVDSVDVGVGRSAFVELKGRNATWASFATGDPEVVSIQKTKGGISVGGKIVGTTTISTGDGEQLRVRVLPVAAQFPQTLTAEVIGSPTSADAAKLAIQRTLQTRLRTLPGVRCDLIGVSKVSSVAMGASNEGIYRVKADSPESLSAEGNVVVNVRNIGIEKASEAELWYSNDPESVPKPQDLFRGTLPVDHPVRLLYHHLNDSAYNLLMKADLVNRTDRTARVAVIPGWAKPNPNPVVAGLDAAEVFMREWLNGSGQVLVVPPHSKLRLVSCPIDHNQTASGLYYLRLLPGGADALGVEVAAVVREPGNGEPDTSTGWQVNSSEALPKWQEVAPPDTPEVYPKPFCDEVVTYRVGEKFGFLRLGEKALSRQTEGTPLYGNFGIIYRVTTLAENPTSLPVDVEIAFESSAGYSGGLFYLEGELRRINPLQPKDEVQLMKFRLEPGEKREVKFLTLPLSGSAYPATIAVRAITRG